MVKQVGRRNGWLPCTCAYVASVLTVDDNCDINESTRRMNVFAIFVLMIMLTSKVFSLALAAFVLLFILMSQ